MNINKIILERNECKQNVKKFATLSGIFLILSIVSIFLLFFGSLFLALLSEFTYDYDTSELLAFFGVMNMLFNFFNIILFAIGSEVFIPFIIINGIKLGIRNKKIDDYNLEHNIYED